MATFTLIRPDVFPDGTTVDAYGPPAHVRGSGRPGGSLAQSVVASSGRVEFSSLVGGGRYVAYAGSPDRYIAFMPDEDDDDDDGGGSATGEIVLNLSIPGTLTVGARAPKFRMPVHATIIGAAITVGTAPTGAAVIVDVNRDGASMFGVSADRPTIAAAATVSEVTVPSLSGLSAGDLLTVDVDQIGSGTAGADLTLTLLMERADEAAVDLTKWESFVDPFNVLNTTDSWTIMSGSASVSAGMLHIPATGGLMETKFTKDLLESSIIIDSTSSGAAWTGGYATAQLRNGDCLLWFALQETPVQLFVKVQDVFLTQTALAEPIWDPVAMRFWRIRETGGLVYFDTSPNKSVWTNRGSRDRATLGHLAASYQSLKLIMGSGSFLEDPPPGLPDWTVPGIN